MLFKTLNLWMGEEYGKYVERVNDGGRGSEATYRDGTGLAREA